MGEKSKNPEEERRKLDEALDEALTDSFPASDPIAIDRPNHPDHPDQSEDSE